MGSVGRRHLVAGKTGARIVAVARDVRVIHRLTFLAVSNKTYTVQFKNALTDPSWGRLTDVTSAPTNRLITIDSLVPLSTRFYRLVTPATP